LLHAMTTRIDNPPLVSDDGGYSYDVSVSHSIYRPIHCRPTL